MELSDEKLMLQYGQGEAAAFETLYHRHKGPLFRYLLRNCGRRGVAEELLQETWMSLIRQRERYTVQAKFTTYLYHIAHSRLIDYYRQQGAAPVESFSDHGVEDEVLSLPGNSGVWPDRAMERRAQAERLRGLIRELPVTQREAFLLHEESGLDLNQIAEVTGVNRETVKSRLRYAVAKLREGLRQ